MNDTGKFFDPLARRYDLLNRIISMGQDGSWRKKALREFPEGDDLHWLDLAAGTGEQILSGVRAGIRCHSIVGLDTSMKMLRIAEEKFQEYRLPVKLVVGDAESLPFPEGHFDAVTCSFGIRNFPKLERCLREVHRVLKPGGRFIALELSVPRNPIVRPFYHAYSRLVIPILGGLLAGQFAAYRYLVRSIEKFPKPETVREIMKEAGFSNVTSTALFFGVCTIFVGERD